MSLREKIGAGTNKPRGDWYFDGYRRHVRPRANGRGTETYFTYHGVYYGFELPPAALTRLKTAFVMLAAAYFAVWLLVSLLSGPVTAAAYIAIPFHLNLAPFIYLCMGVCCLAAAGEEMTNRAFCGSVRRMTRALAVMLALSAAAVAAYAVHMALNGAGGGWTGELPGLGGLLLCLIILIEMRWLLHRYPCVPVRGPEVE